MFDDDSTTEGPRHYSQAAAAAMHHELTAARRRIRQLENLVGILNREADYQASTITELREAVERARSFYMRQGAPGESEKK